MTIDILTIFPEMFESVLNTSILGRARAQGLITIEATDIRPFSTSKHKNTDDYPYGGGAGMLMMAQPIADAMKFICEKRNVPCVQNGLGAKQETEEDNTKVCILENESILEESGISKKNLVFNVENNGTNSENIQTVKRIYLSPRGIPFTQKIAQSLSQEEHIILLCGHYEGVDQRVLDKYIDMEISIGDYVLTGGELGAMVVADCVARLIPGVLGSEESPQDESFSDAGLLEYPQYTRPRIFEGIEVPEVLLNGDHAKIAAWRRKHAIQETIKRRPDLIAKTDLTEKEKIEFGIHSKGNQTH
ncbi:MAG: tRNA (guanosine(37)-N1)-methyltransferase TrmD [Clostridia bacterium]|nr:tRNA (guanosine(37)-N1)-methyltransferase TrmD [Clostridia bacterium]